MRSIIFLLILLPIFAHAGESAFNVSWDNDLLTGSDKGYTNGGRLSYLSVAAEEDTKCEVCLARNARDTLNWLPDIGVASNTHALTFSLTQLIVTPENIDATHPVYEDLPYVGFLSGAVTLWSWNSRTLTGYGFEIGVVGPDSGAEATQKWVHKLTGSTDPEGWGNQLGTDMIAGLHAFHARRLYRAEVGKDMSQEMAWMAGTRLSNFITNGQLGLSWRMGANLPANIIPDYAGSSSTIGMPGSLDAPGPGWSVFVGLGTEFIPYTYLEKQSGRYTYDQRPFIGVAAIGAGWHAPGFQVSVTLRATTSQDKTNKDALSFGTLAAGLRF